MSLMHWCVTAHERDPHVPLGLSAGPSSAGTLQSQWTHVQTTGVHRARARLTPSAAISLIERKMQHPFNRQDRPETDLKRPIPVGVAPSAGRSHLPVARVGTSQIGYSAYCVRQSSLAFLQAAPCWYWTITLVPGHASRTLCSSLTAATARLAAYSACHVSNSGWSISKRLKQRCASTRSASMAAGGSYSLWVMPTGESCHFLPVPMRPCARAACSHGSSRQLCGHTDFCLCRSTCSAAAARDRLDCCGLRRASI